MRRILSIAITSFLVSNTTGNAMAPSSVGRHQTDDSASVRQHFAAINKSIHKYRKVKKALSGFSTEGGELVAYFDGQKTMKIAATYFGETGKAIEEYYFWDDKLIFVFRKEQTYDKPMSGKVARSTENRFYFNNGRLFRWIDDSGKAQQSSTPEYQEKETEYLQSATTFTNGARATNPTIEAP